jgi:hypothetical protein
MTCLPALSKASVPIQGTCKLRAEELRTHLAQKQRLEKEVPDPRSSSKTLKLQLLGLSCSALLLSRGGEETS